MSKESFKLFAKNNKELATSVLDNKVTWQQLYELYEIYGEDSDIWDKYISKKQIKETSIKDILDTIKNIDLNSFQEGIKNIQNTIGIIQSLGLGNNKIEKRPIYKRFEEP